MYRERLDRRVALRKGAVACAWVGAGARDAIGARTARSRVITRGPRHHWFGYYDKLQFDPTGRYVLGMQVAFEHRSPRADDVIRVGMVDFQSGD